jgi:hypothetical protein
MQQIGEIGIINKALTKDKRQKAKDLKPFVRENKVSKQEQAIKCDLALEDFTDLIDPNYKAWFCRAYYILGDGLIRKLAAEARTEFTKSARNMFGWSIKKELIRRGF